MTMYYLDVLWICIVSSYSEIHNHVFHVFLVHTGELHIIILRRKKGPT
jgi:hypothetical protein